MPAGGGGGVREGCEAVALVSRGPRAPAAVRSEEHCKQVAFAVQGGGREQKGAVEPSYCLAMP